MGAKWIKLSVLYLVFGIGVGLFMSLTLKLNWGSAHAHVNLVRICNHCNIRHYL